MNPKHTMIGWRLACQVSSNGCWLLMRRNLISLLLTYVNVSQRGAQSNIKLPKVLSRTLYNMVYIERNWTEVNRKNYMAPIQLDLGDRIRLRKPHPCGSYDWLVVRLGADIGLRCEKCGRRVLLPRAEVERRTKQVLSRAVDADTAPSIE